MAETTAPALLGKLRRYATEGVVVFTDYHTGHPSYMKLSVCEQAADKIERLRAILQDVADDMMFNVAPSKATMAKIHEALSYE